MYALHTKGRRSFHASSHHQVLKLFGMMASSFRISGCSNKVVISPHVYPPTITNAAGGYSGVSLNTRLSLAHGYLNKAPGFCTDAGACKTFPIAVGEFGTRLTEARDLQMMPQVGIPCLVHACQGAACSR